MKVKIESKESKHAIEKKCYTQEELSVLCNPSVEGGVGDT